MSRLLKRQDDMSLASVMREVADDLRACENAQRDEIVELWAEPTAERLLPKVLRQIDRAARHGEHLTEIYVPGPSPGKYVGRWVLLAFVLGFTALIVANPSQTTADVWLFGLIFGPILGLIVSYNIVDSAIPRFRWRDAIATGAARILAERLTDYGFRCGIDKPYNSGSPRITVIWAAGPPPRLVSLP